MYYHYSTSYYMSPVPPRYVVEADPEADPKAKAAPDPGPDLNPEKDQELC